MIVVLAGQISWRRLPFFTCGSICLYLLGYPIFGSAKKSHILSDDSQYKHTNKRVRLMMKLEIGFGFVATATTGETFATS